MVSSLTHKDYSIGIFFKRMATEKTVEGARDDDDVVDGADTGGMFSAGGLFTMTDILDCDNVYATGSDCGDAMLVKCSTNKFFSIIAGMCLLVGLAFLLCMHAAFVHRYSPSLPHFRLYEVVSRHMCVPPYKYRKISEMLLKLMELYEIK